MAISHATPEQIIDVRPLGDKLGQSVTTTLIKTDSLEVIRLVVPAGKEIPQHQVKGEITVQCLEGSVNFSTQSRTQTLQAGQLLYLTGDELHGLKGIEDSSVLVTILLQK